MYQTPYDFYGQHHINTAYKKALRLIKEAIRAEKKDELFYDYLLNVAPTEKEKEIIATIRDDEIRHNKTFKQIYKSLTGRNPVIKEYEAFQKPPKYIIGIEEALFGELTAVEKYREVRKGLPSRYNRDLLFDIITDEIKHANKYNYILTKNKK